MEAGQSYALKVVNPRNQFTPPASLVLISLLCLQEESSDTAIDGAVSVAQSCDVSIVFASRNAEYADVPDDCSCMTES